MKTGKLILLSVILLTLLVFPVSADGGDAAARQLPEWFNNLNDIPAWFITVGTLPDWFYTLPAEPAWFRQVESIPEWFYEITEIPNWFYPSGIDETSPAFYDPDASVPFDFAGDFGASPEPQAFSVPLAGGMRLFANIPNGMITSGEVTLETPAELFITRNGIEIAWLNTPLRDDGEYEVFAVTHPDRIVFSFTIAMNPVNFINTYTAPDGYIIESVSYEGESIVINNKMFDFTADGIYFITLEQNAEWLSAEERDNLYATVQIDRTPPVLTFEGVDEDGNAEGRVTFTISEQAEIRIVRNSRPFAQNIAVLTEPGRYLIIAADAAGNEAVYELRIAYRMDSAGYWFIGLFALMLAGLILYLIHCKRKFRIR
jgi:hypothetical protein